MLIPAWLYYGVFYGLLGAAGIAVLYYAYRTRTEPDQLPRAELATNRWRTRVGPWVPRFMLVGGLVGAWLLNHVSVDVIRVRDVNGRPSAQRMKHLGDVSYPLAPGEKVSTWGNDTWVLNESEQDDVRIVDIDYGKAYWGPSNPTVIPPGTAAVTGEIEYIGPGDQPPSSLEVKGVEAKFGMTTRRWLTWEWAY